MNFFKRAGNSLLYYKKNTLLLFCVFLILGVIIQSGLCILSASKQSVIQVRKNIGASVLVKCDIPKTGDIYYGRNMLSMESVFRIAKLPEVIHFYPLGFSLADGMYEFKPFMTESQARMKEFTNQFRIQGCYDITQLSEFESGDNELILGRNLKSTDQDIAIINQDVAIENHINIGDTIHLDSYYDGESVVLTVIGMYKVNNAAPHTDYEFYNSENLIITSVDTIMQLNNLEQIYSVNFKISDPFKVNEFVKKVKSLDLSEGDNISIIIDNSAYRSISGTINGMVYISIVMVLASLLMGAIILTLLVMILLKDRTYEIGILLSIGENRIKIILQMVIEVLTPILLGATMAVFISSLLIQRITDFFGGTVKITVCVQGYPVLFMYICVIFLTSIASISMIHKIIYYQPHEMLLDIN
jgi:ABC-type transport system, involved in lipoprotein release, permease component